MPSREMQDTTVHGRCGCGFVGELAWNRDAEKMTCHGCYVLPVTWPRIMRPGRPALYLATDNLDGEGVIRDDEAIRYAATMRGEP